MFIDSVCNTVHKFNGDYSQFKNKVISMVNDNDITQFAKQLFFKPNIMASIVVDAAGLLGDSVPLLHLIGSKQNIKMFSLFLHSLIHFSSVILGESLDQDNDSKQDDGDKSFGKEYFNFNECNYPIISESTFV